MIRFLLRCLGFWVFAAALVASVLDGVKSIAASAIVVTPLSETWVAVSPASADAARAAVTDGLGQPLAWEFISSWILGAPTALALGVLGFLLIAAGRKVRHDRFSREFVA